MRAAITGMGVVTPAGVGLERFLDALRETRQSVSELHGVPVPRGKSAAGLVHDARFDRIDRAYRMALAASHEAVSRRGAPVAGADTVLVLSTLAADSEAAERRYAEFRTGEPFGDELQHAFRLFANGALAARLGNRFRIWGARLVISNACASGNVAMGIALDMIRRGLCRRALVCGVELAKLTMLWGAERSGFVGRALRPFHARRDGSVLGEGAGAVVLEHPDDAGDRRVYGWLEGFGCGVDPGAAAITLLEDGSGLQRGMDLALRDAGAPRHRVTYVSAHAPGTPLIDRVECRAIANFFGEHTPEVSVNATKSITTHLSAASAVVETVAVLLQMQEGFLHGNSGLDEPDPTLPASLVGPRRETRTVTYALSNACGGGALNTSVALSAPEQPAQASAPEFLPRRKRLWLTGSGTVSGYGACNGFSGAGRCPSPRLDWFDVCDWFPKESGYEYMNRAAQLGAVAGLLAVRASGLADRYAPSDVAVLSGTIVGGTPETADVLCRTLQDDPNAVRPSMALDHGMHLAASLVRRHFGFYGLTYTLSGSGSAALAAVQVASELLICNRAASAVVVASDALDSALCRAAAVLKNECFPDARLSEGGAAVTIEAGLDGLVELAGWTVLSTSWKRDRAIQCAARRIAASLPAKGWQRIYCAGSALERAIAIGRCLARDGEAGDSSIHDSGAAVESIMPGWYSMSATPMFALAAAAQAPCPSLVVSAERDGNIVAVSVQPRT